MRCGSCGAENAEGSDFCMQCGRYLRWRTEAALPAAKAPNGPGTQPAGAVRAGTIAAGDAGLATLTLRHADAEHDPSTELAIGVEPGGEVRFLALVRNQGVVVDNYDLAVEGLPDEDWWSVTPGTVYLVPFGGQGRFEQEVEVRLHPPRSPEAEARVWEPRLVARSRAHRTAAAEEPFRLAIRPFEQYETTVRPQRRSGRRRAQYDVRIRNTANAPLRAAFAATDTDGECSFAFAPARLDLAPGAAAESTMTVRPPRQLWVGRPQERRLEVATVREDEEGAAPAGLDEEDGGGGRRPKAPQVAAPRLQLGPQGIDVQGPRVEGLRGPAPRQVELDPRKLKLPGLRAARTVTGPLQPSQAVFRQRAWLPWWVVPVVPLLVAAAVAAYLLIPRGVTVPDVLGSPSAFAAEQRLRTAELRLAQSREEVSNQAPPGTVIGQIPGPGDRTPEGSDVTILVAVGDGQRTVPNVVGLTPQGADRALREAGLTRGQVTPGPLLPTSAIVSQIPARGEVVEEGTPVNLFLRPPRAAGERGGGEEERGDRRGGAAGGGAGGGGGGGGGGPVVVPPIEDQSLEAYAKRVSEDGLVPVQRSQFDAAKAGTLIGTDPEPGTEVEGGSRVRLLVSAGAPKLVFDDDQDVLAIDGASGKRLSPVAKTGAQETNPSVAPDGRRVAFVSDGRVALGRLGGDDPPEVLTPEGVRYDYPAWAPSREDDVLALVRVDGDDGDLCLGRIVEGALRPECQTNPAVSVRQPRWSPDGRTLFVSGRRSDGRFGIARHRTDDAFSPRLADWRPLGFATPLSEAGGVSDAAISPDGKRLAVISSLDTNGPRLHLTKADDLRLRDARPLRVRACKVAWRPDSREVVVVDLGADCSDSNGQVTRVPVDDPTKAVALHPGGDNPSFEPRKLPG